MKKLLIITITLAAAVLVACKKDHSPIAGYTTADSSMAYIKIIDAAPNFNKVLGKKDTFNVFVNGTKVNAPYFTFAPTFPNSTNLYPVGSSPSSSAITDLYAAVPAGASAIKLSGPGVVNVDSINIYTLNKYLAAGQYYTLVVTDSLKSANDSMQIFTQDFIPARTPTGITNLRFIDAVMNDTAGKTVDVFSFARNSAILTNVKPGTVTPFAQYTMNQTVIDTFYVTRNVSDQKTPLSQRLILAKIPFNTTNAGNTTYDQRSFTLYYKGDANLTSGSKARSLGIYINR